MNPLRLAVIGLLLFIAPLIVPGFVLLQEPSLPFISDAGAVIIIIAVVWSIGNLLDNLIKKSKKDKP